MVGCADYIGALLTTSRAGVETNTIWYLGCGGFLNLYNLRKFQQSNMHWSLMLSWSWCCWASVEHFPNVDRLVSMVLEILKEIILLKGEVFFFKKNRPLTWGSVVKSQPQGKKPLKIFCFSLGEVSWSFPRWVWTRTRGRSHGLCLVCGKICFVYIYIYFF